MDIGRLYVRTEKGQNALTDKYVTLPFSLKRALIIVDGYRDVGELHTMAPLYDDLDESLQALESEGFIELTTAAGKPEATTPTETANDPQAMPEMTHVANHTSVKWHLISLLQVELGSKSDKNIKAASEKMIREISALPEEYDALSAAWRKCVKVTKITIDVELSGIIHRRGEELLAQLQ